MMRRAARIPVLLAACLVAAFLETGFAFSAPVPLVGQLRVAVCDNLQCEHPRPDDPRWDPVNLGPSGLESPLPHRMGVGWVLLDFQLPSPRDIRNPALLVTNPADAEQVFLNGVFIGGGGTIGKRYATVPGPARVFAIPPGTLRPGGNTLRMNVLFAEKNIDLLDGPFRIGEFDRLSLDAARMRAPAIGMEAAFLTLFALILAFYSFLILKGVVRSDYMLFIAFTATYALRFLAGSNLLHELGIAGPALDQFILVLAPTISLLMLALVTSVTGASYGAVFGLFVAASVGFIVLNLAMTPLEALYMLAGPRKIYLGLSGIYYLAVSLLAVSRRREESVVILLGVTAYVVGSRIELFWGLQMRDYSMGVFVLCMLFALVSRHARLQARLVELSSKLLDAHEDERSRIARDIHDGVGQSLLALKLRIQMLASKGSGEGACPAPAVLEDLAKDTSAIIEEVRRTTMDLRPSFVESMSLTETVKWYAGAFMDRSGIEMNVLAGEDPLPDPPPRIKDNIYRALQEILANARKHSGATRIDISLYRSGGMLVLKVTDNGKGADLSTLRIAGIGLATMRERAELLGGACTVDSTIGLGTTVSIEVPVR